MDKVDLVVLEPHLQLMEHQQVEQVEVEVVEMYLVILQEVLVQLQTEAVLVEIEVE
jgi:hypothetical protein